ncbi:MAG: hypothetical protein A4E66_02736 [Syntrophus sp. PtaB.Bin001]|nr:MAG: hypothetical protein A4E66_02736 [Syntrophus sp. PtaB.Bin001]
MAFQGVDAQSTVMNGHAYQNSCFVAGNAGDYFSRVGKDFREDASSGKKGKNDGKQQSVNMLRRHGGEKDIIRADSEPAGQKGRFAKQSGGSLVPDP